MDENGKRVLKKPQVQAKHLGIDEFKLHDGNVFATIIIDLDLGHVLWLAHGKKNRLYMTLSTMSVRSGWTGLRLSPVT